MGRHGRILSLFLSAFGLLFSCSHFSKAPKTEFYDLKVDAHQISESETPLGGFSGLRYVGKSSENGNMMFLSHSDRGPNGPPFQHNNQTFRSFVRPNFQPRWYFLELDSSSGQFFLKKEVLLTDSSNGPLSGLPQSGEDGRDERGADVRGQPLADNPNGIDPEGICIDRDNFYWMVEEYRPSILKFTPQGKLLKRFIPFKSLSQTAIVSQQKSPSDGVLVEALPAEYGHRKQNRGFEAVACRDHKIYAVLQSPLPNEKDFIRVIEFDSKIEKVTAEFRYPVSRIGVDKIGDLDYDSETSQFYIIEQNGKTGKDSKAFVTRFGLPKPPSLDIEPKLCLSLSEMGFSSFEKLEGLALISPSLLAIVNDNDFSIKESGSGGASNWLFTTEIPTRMGIVNF